MAQRGFRKGGVVNVQQVRTNPYKKGIQYKKKKPTVQALAKKIDMLQEDVELKYKDTEFVLVPFTSDSSTSIVLLNGIPGSTGPSGRIGQELRMTSVHFRAVITRDALELSPQTVRLMIIYDKTPNGTAVAFGNLVDNSVINNADFLPYCPYNRDLVPGRFKILYDKSYVLNPQVLDSWTEAPAGTFSPSGYAPMERLINKKIPLQKRSVYGLGGGSAITDISIGSLYMVCIGSQPVAGPNYTIDGGCRLFYKDA